MAEILVVDDELGIRNVLSEVLADAGYYVSAAGSAQEARELVRSRRFELILLDIWMPGTDGISLLREWTHRDEVKCPIVMMSGHASIEAAMQAVRDGAADFLEKPISLKRLLSTIESVIAKWKEAEYRKQKELLERQEKLQKKPSLQPQPQQSTQSQDGVALTDPQRLPVYEIPELMLTLDFNLPHREVLLALERAYFCTLLIYYNHSVSLVAKHSNMERTHLYRKVKTLGINIEELRAPKLDQHGELIIDDRRARLLAKAKETQHPSPKED